MSGPIDMRTDIVNHGAKFLLVSVIAFLADMALVALLLTTTNLSTYTAMSLSFGLTVIAVYFAHELWTFRAADSRFSLPRLASTASIAVFSLSVRLAVLFVLKQVVTSHVWVMDLLLITLASGVSLAINFIMNSWVFRRARS